MTDRASDAVHGRQDRQFVPRRVLVGVYHGDCDRLTVDATRPGDVVVTITTRVPKGAFCAAAGRISGLDVEVPAEAGPYTLILRHHRTQ